MWTWSSALIHSFCPLGRHRLHFERDGLVLVGLDGEVDDGRLEEQAVISLEPVLLPRRHVERRAAFGEDDVRHIADGDLERLRIVRAPPHAVAVEVVLLEGDQVVGRTQPEQPAAAQQVDARGDDLTGVRPLHHDLDPYGVIRPQSGIAELGDGQRKRHADKQREHHQTCSP